jgi:hypothetical protein
MIHPVPLFQPHRRHLGLHHLLPQSGFVNRHQAVAIGVRQRLQQHRVDYGEDRAVRPDSEREGQHNRDKERRPSKQAPVDSHGLLTAGHDPR